MLRYEDREVVKAIVEWAYNGLWIMHSIKERKFKDSSPYGWLILEQEAWKSICALRDGINKIGSIKVYLPIPWVILHNLMLIAHAKCRTLL